MKVNLISLGCSKNLVDSEVLLNQLNENRFKVVKDPANSDVVIINTCGFIEDAKNESIETILQAVSIKKNDRKKRLIVMGCLSERYKEDLKRELPEVDEFYGVNDLENIVQSIGGNFKKELIGERFLLNPKHFAYLKISEGCDHPCSFCAIPLMRGKQKSKKMKDILHEAESLAKKGIRELIIIAQDTTAYGMDLYEEKKLPELINKIVSEKYFDWIRIMYAYPSHFPEKLIETIAQNETVCKYIDLPIQHISDNVLKSMRRGITKKATYKLLEKLRKQIPELYIRTTLLTGYPNESEEDFEELLQFVRDFRFERLGVFTYSPEEGTTAFPFGDPLVKRIKNQRKNKIMRLQRGISDSINSGTVGKTFKVLVDEISENNIAIARSQWDAPEIDNEIIFKVPKKIKAGQFCSVKISDYSEYELIGEYVNDI